jgi:hypothetical protein
MNERLERALIAVARRSAPSLVPGTWKQPGDYPHSLSELAGALASHNVLVLIGDLPSELSHQAAVHFKDWADSYVQLYTQLCETLFPSFTQVNAYYADQEWPPVVVVYGAATPVIVALAEYVAPYVVARQRQTPTDVELRGLMDTVLDELEATDLPRDDYRRLRDEGVFLLKQLLTTQVRQLPLTPSAISMMSEETVVPAPMSLPAALSSPALPPDTLPEDVPSEPLAKFQTGEVPIFFDVGRQGTKRRPPVPDLPESLRGEDRS